MKICSKTETIMAADPQSYPLPALFPAVHYAKLLLCVSNSGPADATVNVAHGHGPHDTATAQLVRAGSMIEIALADGTTVFSAAAVAGKNGRAAVLTVVRAEATPDQTKEKTNEQ
jgi:hypothetical protein